MERSYKIADQVIRIVSLYEQVHRDCEAYSYEGEPELEVEIRQEDLQWEREKTRRTALSEGRAVIDWPDSYLETLAVYRKISEWMPFRDTFLMHCSAVAADGKAYVFTAKSGTGKSTHVRLWREMLGGRAVMINDDKPLIRVMADGSAVAYGTPWNGKHHLGENTSAPLAAICILGRAPQNTITPVSKTEAYPMLLQQIYRPALRAAYEAELALIERLNVPLYRLGCNMDPEAAEVSFRGMGGVL